MAKDFLTEASQVEQEYKRILDFKKQQGYLTKWAEYERFKAGEQWPQPTDKTKNLPRPVFNVIKQIENHKIASVMNENIKMVFTAEEIPEPQVDEQGNEIEAEEVQAADLFTRFADSTWERIKQDKLNEQMLDSASNIGTGILHYYWDNTKAGGMSKKWIGQLDGEVIDPVNYFPGNPQQLSVQKQPFNIITHRDLVSNVKKEAKENEVSKELINMITPDSETTDQAYDMAQQEVSGSDKVTVITKYWKHEDGFIHFKKIASGIVIKPDTNTKRKLYPLVVMQWDTRKASIFGVGDTEGLIPNQKAINFLIAMEILSAQLTGWPKLLVKSTIRQQISNTPGEIILDDSPPGHDGAKYLNPGQISGHVPELVNRILEYTKEVTGANDTAMGEQQSSDLNATAIMLLQKAAGIPIESIKRRFYQAMEDVGRIWEEFWKVNYNTDRMVTLKNDDREEFSTTFNGTNYQEQPFNLKIDIGPSSSYSESLMMTSLDKFLDNQYITFDQYLKYAPKNVVPFKDRLLKEIQDQQEQQANDPMTLIQQLTQQEQQAFMNAPPELQQQILSQIQQPQIQQPNMPNPNAIPMG